MLLKFKEIQPTDDGKNIAYQMIGANEEYNFGISIAVWKPEMRINLESLCHIGRLPGYDTVISYWRIQELRKVLDFLAESNALHILDGVELEV